jgi:hypothetical protein
MSEKLSVVSCRLSVNTERTEFEQTSTKDAKDWCAAVLAPRPCSASDKDNKSGKSK